MSHAEYDIILQEFTWTLLVLLYFAASDGSIKAKEREVVADFFKRRSESGDLDSSIIIELLGNFGRPDKTTFHKLVRERIADDSILQDVYDTAWQIIRCNARIHTEQERAIDYLKKSWSGRISL